MARTVKKLTTLYQSDGTNQLNEVIGKPVDGDICEFHIIGKIIPKQDKHSTGFCCCITPSTEWIDTQHMGKRVRFEVGRQHNQNDGIYRAFHQIFPEMNLGDEMTFFIPSELAFDSRGLSMCSQGGGGGENNNKPDHMGRNPVPVSFLTIQPNTDLEVTIILFRLQRNKTWHNRKIKNKPNVLNAGFHSAM